MSDKVLVLTHEYSDGSHFQICGVTQDYTVARAWIYSGCESHAYEIPLNQLLPIHPDSVGWMEWRD